MRQELFVGSVVQKDRSSAVPIAGESSRSDECSVCIAGGDFIDKTIRSRQPLYSMSVSSSPVSHWQELLIRSLDIVGSAAIFVLAMPLIAGVAVMIKAFSPGRVLYKQHRVGKRGEIFTLFKFRTMVDNSEEQTGPIWAEQDDPRVTSIGKFLRRTRLDERFCGGRVLTSFLSCLMCFVVI